MTDTDSDTRATSYRRMADDIAAARGRANGAHEQRCNRIVADRRTSAEQKAALVKASSQQRATDLSLARHRAEEDHLSRSVAAPAQ